MKRKNIFILIYLSSCLVPKDIYLDILSLMVWTKGKKIIYPNGCHFICVGIGLYGIWKYTSTNTPNIYIYIRIYLCIYIDGIVSIYLYKYAGKTAKKTSPKWNLIFRVDIIYTKRMMIWWTLICFYLSTFKIAHVQRIVSEWTLLYGRIFYHYTYTYIGIPIL